MMKKVSSDCFVTNGFLRAIICDTLRQNYFFSPKFNSINELSNNFINFLSENEILFDTNNLHHSFFKKINLEYEPYSFITNTVITFNGDYYQKQLSEFLKKILCYNIAIHIIKYNHSQIVNLLNDLAINHIECVEIHITDPTLNSNEIKQINQLYNDFSFNFIYLYTNNNSLLNYINNFENYIYFKKIDFFSPSKISTDLFYCNLKLLTESQKHNTYFNRKLHIDEKGDIKNSQLTSQIFGNINELNDTSEILDIINTKEFQKYWYVHKGLIDVCKQCEFRHMCVDNRVPIKRTEKEWFFETECNYNPYIAKWQDEDGYKTLEECGIQSNANGFKLNRKKLNAINKELWGDD